MADRPIGMSPGEGPDEAFDEGTIAESDPAMLRNSAGMAIGTIISRVTGVARDIAIVAAIGFGPLADAYTLGNTLPNTIYLLLVGGALSAVFVPQLVRHLKEDADGGDAYANRLLTLTVMVLLVLAVASVLLAPWIVSLYVPDDYPPDQYELAVAFARLCLPQIFFYGVYTMLSQVLNSRHHFAAPMFAPVVNNIIVISMAVAFLFVVGDASTVQSITSEQVLWLGIGTTAGVVAQALVLIPVLGKVDYKLRPRFDFRGSGLGKTARLAGWTVAAIFANQVALLVTSRLAVEANIIASQEGVVEQGLMTFDKAYLVFMLPSSVITISLVTAMLPRMSASAAEGDLSGVAGQITNGARLIGALIVPAAALLIAFGPVVTTLVFGYGAGSGAAATYTGVVVTGFAFGLLPFSLYYLLIRGWYALEDTRTPFFVTTVFNALLVLFMVLLFEAAPAGLKILSLAVAESLAYWLALLLAWWWLSRRLHGMQTRETAGALARMLVAGVAAASVGFLVGYVLRVVGSRIVNDDLGVGYAGKPLLAGVSLLIGASITIVVYLVMCRVLIVRELDDVIALVRDRVPVLRRSRGKGTSL